jgi:Trk-type K+ transport system membrane component
MAWGAVALLSPKAWPAGQEMAADRAVFAVINAATLTGFPTTRGLSAMPSGGMAQWTVFGLMCAGALLTLIIGGWAISAISGARYRLSHILTASLLMLGISALLGAAFLAGSGDFAHGAFNGIAALSNCGLTMGKPAAPGDLTTHALRLPLAILGGLGAAVVLEILGSLRGRPLSKQSRSVLLCAAAVYLVGTAILLAMIAGASSASWPTALAQSSAWCLASRTGGFFTSLSSLPRSAQWFVLILMGIGASSGGTGGGLKSNTLGVLFGGLKSVWRGDCPGRVVAIAGWWLVAYAVIAGGCMLALAGLTSDLPPDRLLFLSISAASNVGICYDPVSITGPALWVLSGTMLLGRIIPLGMIWCVWRKAAQEQLVVG